MSYKVWDAFVRYQQELEKRANAMTARLADEDDFRAGYEAARPAWIKCEERLPDICEASGCSDDVWVLHSTHRLQDRAHYDSNRCSWRSDHEYLLSVTHWQPLPPLPEQA